MALFGNPGVRVRFLSLQTLLPFFCGRREAASAVAKRKPSEARLSRVAKTCKARFASTNQRGRREAASAWRVKAERSEAFTRQQGLQAVVTSATFLREKGQEGEKEEGKEYEME